MPRIAALTTLILLAAGSPRPGAAEETRVVLRGYGAAEVWEALRGGFGENSSHQLDGTPEPPTELLEKLSATAGTAPPDCLLVPGSSAIRASREGLFQPYNPIGLAAIPAGYRDRSGRWFTAYSATISLVAHEGALGKITLPGSWQDLAREPFRGKVAYEDPRAGGSGFTFLFGINQLLGGTAEDFEPALAYLESLHQNGARALDATTAARARSKGEIGVWIGLDADGYRQRETGAPMRVIIPREGTFQHLMAAGLATGASHTEAAQAFLDWLIEPTTQTLLGRAYLQPVLLSATPAEIARGKLPPMQYARSRALPLPQMADAFEAMTAAWAERFDSSP